MFNSILYNIINAENRYCLPTVNRTRKSYSHNICKFENLKGYTKKMSTGKCKLICFVTK